MVEGGGGELRYNRKSAMADHLEHRPDVARSILKVAEDILQERAALGNFSAERSATFSAISCGEREI